MPYIGIVETLACFSPAHSRAGQGRKPSHSTYNEDTLLSLLQNPCKVSITELVLSLPTVLVVCRVLATSKKVKSKAKSDSFPVLL